MISRRKLLIAAPALWLPRTKAARFLRGTVPTVSGLQFNLILDPSWSSAPASYVTALSQAIPLLQAAYPHANVTLNIHVGYQTYWASPSLPAISVPASSSIGIPVGIALSVPYATIRAAMVTTAAAVPGGTLSTIVSNTPAGSSLNSTSSFSLPSAAAKALGMFGLSGGPVSARDPTIVDGSFGVGSGWSSAKLVGVMLHEITHAMGRAQTYAPYVFTRFTSVGNRDFFSSNTLATYFAIDGGTTKLADNDWKSTGGSDGSDFLNLPDGSGVQDPLDCLSAFQQSGANQFLSTLDNQVMAGLGFQ